MEELVKQIVTNAGLSEDAAKGALGGLLSFAKSNLSGDLFSKISSALPGTEQLLQAEKADTGLLGGLAKQAASAIGGNLGGAIGLASAFSKFNLDQGQISSVVSTFTQFLTAKGETGIVDQIKEQLPDIGNLIK